MVEHEPLPPAVPTAATQLATVRGPGRPWSDALSSFPAAPSLAEHVRAPALALLDSAHPVLLPGPVPALGHCVQEALPLAAAASLSAGVHSGPSFAAPCRSPNRLLPRPGWGPLHTLLPSLPALCLSTCQSAFQACLLVSPVGLHLPQQLVAGQSTPIHPSTLSPHTGLFRPKLVGLNGNL